MAERTELEDAQAASTLDLARVFPDLTLSYSGSQLFPIVTLRGVTSAQDFYNPALTVYVDGVPQLPVAAIQSLVDVERVELLKGPQGTLYGKSAQGGVLNIVTHQPDGTPQAIVRAGVSSHGGYQAQANVSGPLVRDLLYGSVSLAGSKVPRWAYLRFGVDMRVGSFLEHHQDAFTSLGGVPRVILYDNLKAAVAQRIGDAIVFNRDLEAFATHYGYEPRPVAPYRGNEKGRVERAIRHIRTSFFVGRTFRDLDDLNAQAEAWCREVRGELRHPDDRSLTVIRALEEEREVLRKLPADAFPVADKVEVAIGKTPYARFDGNDYSVPHDRVKKTLTVNATRDTVRIIDGGDVVATHARSWGKGGQFEDASHIAALVSAKRKAAESHGMNRVFKAVPEAQELVRRLAERGGNIGHAVVRLGRLLDTYGAQRLSSAVVEAIASNAPHIAGVLQILDREHPVEPQKVTLPDRLKIREIVVRQAPLAAYDALKKKGPTS